MPESNLKLLLNNASSFLDLYISEEDIFRLASEMKKSRTEIINDFMPTKNNIRSGDFGEMICALLLHDEHGKDLYYLHPKWRWKYPEKPASGTDVILLKFMNGKPSDDDCLISSECKTKSTKNNGFFPIAESIEGAVKDRKTRICATLKQYEYQLKQCLLKKDCKISEVHKHITLVNRYRKPIEYGSYKKNINATTIIEKVFAEEEKLKAAQHLEKDLGINIIILSIPNLKQTLQTLYENIPLC